MERALQWQCCRLMVWDSHFCKIRPLSLGSQKTYCSKIVEEKWQKIMGDLWLATTSSTANV
jgi:hypothetical protein